MKSFTSISIAFSIALSSVQAFQPSIVSRSALRIRPTPKQSVSQVHSFSPFDFFDLSNAMSTLDSFYQTTPYEAAFTTCGIKASAADFLAQKRESGDNKDKEKVEFERNLAFILYGGLYQGIAQYFIYNVMFPQWFGSGHDIITVGTQVVFDLGIISPFLCLPVAYLTKSTIYGNTPIEGMKKYVNDVRYQGLLLKYYKIWFPAQCLTFGVVPEHLRIVFIACVSFFWLILLSSITATPMENAVNEESS
mmetsp:Transcript_4673/g.6521  ORF Transcript_4673/g.6521 Transcript_4673/m.6521 type:complete len:249 (+) Transcript_4673:44-790(+)